MSYAVATSIKADSGVGQSPSASMLILEAAGGCLRQWMDCCRQFLDWERKRIIEVDPSAETLEQHRKALKLLLRVTRLLHAEASDSDFPDRSFSRELAICLRKLEDSWQMIHDPMPAAEAEAILKTAFPDER